MAGSFEIIGDNAEITFVYGGPTEKAQNVLENFALVMWDRGFGDHTKTWEELTNQDKIDLTDEAIEFYIIAIARAKFDEQQLLNPEAAQLWMDEWWLAQPGTDRE
jgi:hypothetical protein